MANSKWRSTFIVSAMTMLSRVLGLVRDVVLMNVFGAGGVMDAFLTAFRIPNFFRRLFAEGAFANAFIPVLSDYKTLKTEQEVRALISKASGSLALVLSLLTLIAVVAAPAVIYLFAPGFADEPEKFNASVELLRLTFPYLIFMSLTAFAGSILQSYGSFATAAFAPVLLNIVMISTALWLSPIFSEWGYAPIMALGWGVLIAGVLQLLIQLPELWQKKLLVKPSVDFKDSGVKQILTLMLPALFGVSVVQINLLLNTVWASFMENGSVTWLYTAERMTELPLGLIGIAISSVILPALSSRHAEKDDVEFRKTLDWAAQVIFLVGVPASIAMAMLASPIMQVLFQHSDKFSLLDVKMSSYALQAMAFSVLAFMLIKIFAPGFYARKDTKTPVKIGLITVGVNIVLNIIMLLAYDFFHIEQYNIPKHIILALSSSIAAILNALLLYLALRRHGIFKFESHWFKIALRYALGNIVMIVVLWFGLENFYNPHGNFTTRLLAFLGLCAVGGAAYFAAIFIAGFRIRHIR